MISFKGYNCCCGILGYLSISILSLFVALVLSSNPASATDYTASLSTSGAVNISATAGTTAIGSSNITVSTNCRAGYNLTLATSVNDNNLYLDGDIANNEVGTFISPSDGTSTLQNSTNTWGYLLPASAQTIPDATSTFLPVSSDALSPTILKTTQQTSSAQDISDSFSIYYGTNVDITLRMGSYRMIPSDSSTTPPTYGGLVYYLTMDTTCTNVTTLDITFNRNLDGEGDNEDPNSTVSNFPSSSENVTDAVNHTLTLSSKTPARSGYIFLGWNTLASGTGITYQPGAVITIGNDSENYELSGNVTLYAMWEAQCPAGYICYSGNGANAGTMDNQLATSNASNTLTSSNFSRSGYGFAGWNTEPDGSGTNYGPGQNMNPGNLSTTGLNLFAHWIAPSGTLQTWANASNMSVGDVIALKDNRDNEVYAVAKLADNNIWFIENLRLIPSAVTFNSYNTNNPTADFISAAPSSSSTTTQCSDSSTGCLNHVYYYADNMDRTKIQSPTTNDSNYAWYSYGVMYNWYTATAGNGTASKSSGNVSGDICPSGWRLPIGGNNGEYYALATALGGTGSTGAANIRKYPNNFIWSGDYNPSTIIPDGRGTQARLWHGTAYNADKAFRMGYNSSTITPVNNYNKWDNFAVRCLYQGGNLHYANVEVDFAGTGITSLTFTNNIYDTETATPNNPIVSIVENATYTATATLTNGYEVLSWSAVAGGTLGNTSTTNPAINPNTFMATDDTTLTITGQLIPSYEVELTLGEHVTGISFASTNFGTETITPNSTSCTDNGDNTYTCTINLRRGVEYTLSSDYEIGYTIDEWTVGNNSTIGSSTSATTTYTITGITTLSLTAAEADETSYTLIYATGQGTDAPESETIASYHSTQDFTITNSAPIYYGYTFTGWSETADANNNGTTVDYVSGDTITIASTGALTAKTLYPVYTANTCPSGRICYFDNGADVLNGGRGTMTNRSASSNSSANLLPSNYSKAGYGFAGWAIDAVTTPYGPNAAITTGDLSSQGLSLYAKWVKSTGDLQTWNGCNSLSINDVTALTDVRDNNTYAVAKLGDDKCWIIENLRLVPSTANITNSNTHNPAGGFATAAAGSSSSVSLCGIDGDVTCNDKLQYNTNNLDRTLTQSYYMAGDNVAWYSYGVYYNWYTATAGNGTIATNANTNVAGDICPAGWHLPTGNNGEWTALNTAVNSGNTSPNMDAGLRAYPVNLLWSGDYNKTSRTNAQSNGRYWTATGFDGPNAYRMGFQGSSLAYNGNYRKWDAFAVRCVYDGNAVSNNNQLNNQSILDQSLNLNQANNDSTENNLDSLSTQGNLNTAIMEPDTNSTYITDTNDTNTIDKVTDAYSASQGVTKATNEMNQSSSAMGLAVTATMVAASGLALSALARRQDG